MNKNYESFFSFASAIGKKRIANLLSVYFIFLALSVSSGVSAKDVVITDFGAVSDSTRTCTEAIQRAIDACAESGGGRVIVPTGSFMTGTLWLRSHVELYLERNARLLGGLRVPDDYPVRTLIYAEGIEDAGISGYGTIDGYFNHPSYKGRFQVNDDKRPLGVFFKNCKNISVRDIHIVNAGSWTLRLLGCDGVHIDGITIRSLMEGNNDGIDVDARNVTISNCYIMCDDDAICLKSDLPDFMPENITVTNCVLASNCNPIKMGTASYAGFRNVVFSNCVIRRTDESRVWDWSKEYRKVAPGTLTGLSGITIQSVDGGTVENISFSNIVMEGIITPIFVCLNHRHGDRGVIRNLQFSNITARAEGILPCMISGVPDNVVSDIILRDIVVEHTGGEQPMQNALPENLKGYPENRMYGRENPAGGLYVRHANNVVVENFQVRHRATDYRPTVVLDDVTDFRLRGLKVWNSANKDYVKTNDCKQVIVEK